MSDQERRRKLVAFSQELTARGALIEAGWVGLQLAAIPSDAPQRQLEEMRMAFFAGAQHLFSSIMAILDPGAEPTEADEARMQLIHVELERFAMDFAQRHGLHGGPH